MNIAIVDDNMKECKDLINYIKQYCTEHQIHSQIRSFETGSEFLSDFQNNTYDLIFLDIYLGEENGVEIARSIREKNTNVAIIFSTSSEAHAIEGFQVRAVDYLVKPYDHDTFSRTMDHCTQSISKHSYYIEVKEGRHYTKIFVTDIIYTDYYNHYIQIHTKDRVIRSYMSFSDFSPLLEQYPQFLSCCRNCLINMDEVESLEPQDFLMTNGERIPITRVLRSVVRQTYADYMFNWVSGDV